MLSIENEEQQETAERWEEGVIKGELEEEESGRPQLPWVCRGKRSRYFSGVAGVGSMSVSGLRPFVLFRFILIFYLIFIFFIFYLI